MKQLTKQQKNMLLMFVRDQFKDDQHFRFFETIIEKEKGSVDDSMFQNINLSEIVDKREELKAMEMLEKQKL